MIETKLTEKSYIYRFHQGQKHFKMFHYQFQVTKHFPYHIHKKKYFKFPSFCF